jgi:GT2 family glycosyltransferase
MCTLSIIIVNYNNGSQLRSCLPTLLPHAAAHGAEVLLSDNGSRDGSVAWVQSTYPTVRVLENHANLGFAEANNRALAVARGAFFLLLNPDTVLDADPLGPLLHALRAEAGVGAVGCRLVAASGARQISARSFPTLTTFAAGFLGLDRRYPRSRVWGRYALGDWDGDSARDVDWVCGAALLVRREVVEHVGGLDPYYFLTYDEVDWCRRIRDAGYRVRYTPDATIVHLVGQSAPQSDASSAGRLRYMTVERNSRVHYFAKHHGPVYACLVELLHVVCAALLLTKARLVGSRRSPANLQELRLLLRLNGCTVRGLVAWAAGRLTGRRTGRGGVFVNPYLAPGSTS